MFCFLEFVGCSCYFLAICCLTSAIACWRATSSRGKSSFATSNHEPLSIANVMSTVTPSFFSINRKSPPPEQNCASLSSAIFVALCGGSVVEAVGYNANHRTDESDSNVHSLSSCFLIVFVSLP